MGILPHTDVSRAMDLALSLDIPFWPQLPRRSFYEDMYVQASENFPGIDIDMENEEIHFSLNDFYDELNKLVSKWDNEHYFRLSEKYSDILPLFLKQDFDDYAHIRGQMIGPISFGLRVVDDEGRPIIYNREIKDVLFPFIRKKVIAQRNQLGEIHPSPLVWIDEPGLEALFSAFTGYTDTDALNDYHDFLEEIPSPRGVHLCGNPDWSFLLQLEIEVLSVDALAHGHILVRYFDQFKDFINRGGIISWGITPTLKEEVNSMEVEDLVKRLAELWDYMAERGLHKKQIARQSWLAPARCCIINPEGDDSVDKSIGMMQKISGYLREKYRLY